jgi:hypothetical protein
VQSSSYRGGRHEALTVEQIVKSVDTAEAFQDAMGSASKNCPQMIWSDDFLMLHECFLLDTLILP